MSPKPPAKPPPPLPEKVPEPKPDKPTPSPAALAFSFAVLLVMAGNIYLDSQPGEYDGKYVNFMCSVIIAGVLGFDLSKFFKGGGS